MSVKIAFIGPESCGKTTLTLELQAQLTQLAISNRVVPEYARRYYADRPYHVTMQDIEHIAETQYQLEQQALLEKPQVLLCDTNVMTCKIWAEVAFGTASPKLLVHYPPRGYDFNFLLAPDIAWQFDPLRSHPTQREWLFELYEKELQDYGIHYQIIKGNGQKRSEQALHTILSLLT